MKFVKTRVCNNMLEEFHKDSLIMYIEREIVEKCDSNVIIEEFFVKKKNKKRLATSVKSTTLSIFFYGYILCTKIVNMIIYIYSLFFLRQL